MAQDRIDEIIQQRQKAEKQAEAPAEGDKFYSVFVGDAIQEHFMEFQFANGLQTCFSYTDLMWFNHDPEAGCIDLAFGDFLVTIKGRGLKPIFESVKQKRVGWVKEADAQLQDHKGNETFIQEISITPPKNFTEEQADS